MHFAQIATAALALPVLGMAAALPEKRQTGNCSGFRYLAVGAISIANTDSGAGTVTVQVRPEGSSKEADWQTVATIEEGTQMKSINYLANGPGRKRLRVCKVNNVCIYPAGEDKQWSMEQSGDRYSFELDVGRRDNDNAYQVQCDSRGRVYEAAPTTMITVTTTTATIAPPLTTVTTTTQTISSPPPVTTTKTTTKTKTNTTTKATTTTTKRRDH